MATHVSNIHQWMLLLVCTFTLTVGMHGTATDQDRQAYIVYMGDLPKGAVSTSTFHARLVEELVGSGGSAHLLHSYHRSFNGFVAKLTNEEKERLAAKKGVVSVFPNLNYELLTTKSWDFLAFPKNVTRNETESDVIIGMLDSGIWPESKSFSDQGFGPPPSKWKGICSSNFTCNNKIIGARYYRADGLIPAGEYVSPRDKAGHGTHTASTAAGSVVEGASMLGLATGTARGGVPSARIAVYKVCWVRGACPYADILAAFDDAIADGVDIISLSVGGSPRDYFKDPIAIGAFHAMKNGILTSNSAGNSGPKRASITNVSPWSLSVAASTIDRKIVTALKLGNGATYEGTSINTFEPQNPTYPIISGANAANLSVPGDSVDCSVGSLNKTLVAGKIVYCDLFGNGSGALSANAVGSVMPVGNYEDVAFNFAFPVAILSESDTVNVKNYLNSTNYATASILKSITHEDKDAPSVVSFSSRGPNPITSDILKPDITAPGVDILAAWTEGNTVTGIPEDPRVVPYNIISGTSMSCPHATGAAAYIKAFHPTWSPAAIKSALMTTAAPLSPEINPDAEFAFGSGQIYPTKAVDPGLVYDAGEIDYVQFLCGQGYNATQIKLVTGDNSACSSSVNGSVWNLNYPSFALSGPSGSNITRVFRRVVTNVGPAKSSYKAVVYAPPKMKVQVDPEMISFESVGEKQDFFVKVEADLESSDVVRGFMVWEDGVHFVKSPIVAFVSDA